MIANELERAVAEYLAVSYGATLPSGKNPIPVKLGQGTLNIYQGEGNTTIQLPALIVSCDQTSQDEDSGNSRCTLNVLLRVQANLGNDNPVPLEELSNLSKVMYQSMLFIDLVGQINKYASEDLTCIAVYQQSQSKTARERIVEHALTNTVYAANTNVR